MSVFVPEVQAQARAASLLLVQRVREYFTDEEHRKAAESWYEQKYGKKYQWKPINGGISNGS